MTDGPDASRLDREQSEQERPAPTIRDRRRIDPETYQVRDQGAASDASDVAPEAPEADVSASAGGDAEGEVTDERDARIADLTRQVAERTDDLQRLQAEYVNYKRRVDRDRETARQATIGTLLNELLPVLDNIASAREHEELVGGFKAVGEAVEKFATSHGLESYGVAGDEFDPRIHEALMQLPDAGDGHPVCAQVFQVGINFTDAAKLSGACAAEQTIRRTPDASRYLLTEAMATGPAMFDTARLDRAVGATNSATQRQRPAASAGLRTASLDEVLCISGRYL